MNKDSFEKARKVFVGITEDATAPPADHAEPQEASDNTKSEIHVTDEQAAWRKQLNPTARSS
jgi:hypothetical protein